MYLYICPSRDNQTSLQTRKPPIPPAALPVPSLRLSPPSLFTSLSPFLLCFSAVPIQLAQQQHGEPGEPRNVRQPLQLRERLLVGRAHPFALLPAQLHVWGPFACPDHPLQHRLPWTACLPGVLPTVQHRQVCNMDREYTNFPVCVHVCVHVCVFRLLWTCASKLKKKSPKLSQVCTCAGMLCARESSASFIDSSCPLSTPINLLPTEKQRKTGVWLRMLPFCAISERNWEASDAPPPPGSLQSL